MTVSLGSSNEKKRSSRRAPVLETGLYLPEWETQWHNRHDSISKIIMADLVIGRATIYQKHSSY